STILIGIGSSLFLRIRFYGSRARGRREPSPICRCSIGEPRRLTTFRARQSSATNQWPRYSEIRTAGQFRAPPTRSRDPKTPRRFDQRKAVQPCDLLLPPLSTEAELHLDN